MAVAVGIFALMTTWKAGRAVLATQHRQQDAADQRLPDRRRASTSRIACRGTAVFMAANPNGVPIVLLHHWKHNQVLHETLVLLFDRLRERARDPRRQPAARARRWGTAFYQVTAYYGFMETPNVPQILREAGRTPRIPYSPETVSYYLGRETLLPTGQEQDVALAKVALLVHLAQRPLGDAILRHPAGPGRRARDADRPLTT